MMMQMRQNLEQRLTLMQKLELKSDMLESCLVRSEELLKDRKYQKGLTLLYRVVDAEPYRGILDWLLGVFVPDLRGDIFAYYAGRGPNMVTGWKWSWIDATDRSMVVSLQYLARTQEERWMMSLRGRSKAAEEMQGLELDLVFRPLFQSVCPLETGRRVAG